jgi:hypothetical protein
VLLLQYALLLLLLLHVYALNCARGAMWCNEFEFEMTASYPSALS